MKRPKIEWIGFGALRTNPPDHVYDLVLMARPTFGEERLPVDLADVRCSLGKSNAFMLPEPWLANPPFRDVWHGRPPRTSKKNWRQLRMVLAKRYYIGIGWLTTDDRPVDMRSLAANVPVVAHAQWNKKMAHTYTAAWPTEAT